MTQINKLNPLHGRQWTYGKISDERDARSRRVPLDRCSPAKAKRLYGGTGERERGTTDCTVCKVSCTPCIRPFSRQTGSMFGFLKKFDRAAVLTDKTWLKKVSELEGALFPGLEIKAFNRDQKVEAEDWLSR